MNPDEKSKPAIRKIPMTFEGVFENILLPMFLVDRERKVVKINMTALRALKLSMDDPFGQRFGNAVHCIHSVDSPQGCGFGPNCRGCVMRLAIQKCFEDQKNLDLTEVDLEVYIKRDTPVKVYLTVTAILLSNDEKQYLLVCLQDHTTQKETEISLRNQLAELKTRE
jgi:hypothetical protein